MTINVTTHPRMLTSLNPNGTSQRGQLPIVALQSPEECPILPSNAGSPSTPLVENALVHSLGLLQSNPQF